jgi:DNA polymerase-1
MSNGERLTLIDASGFIFRAFFALPPLARHDNQPIGAVFGYCMMLNKILREWESTHIGVVFDAGRVTFRQEIYPEYKAHRPAVHPDLSSQFSLVRDATRAFGFHELQKAGYEADDLIATYAAKMTARGGETVIVSADKDLMQLVSPNVTMFDPIKRKPIGALEVWEKLGVWPKQVVDLQAIMGDAVDNVPGVKGIGQKGAAALLNQFGTLEAILDAAETHTMPATAKRAALEVQKSQALLSKRLVTLKHDAPVPYEIDELVLKPCDHARLDDYLVSQGFEALREELAA